MIDVFLDNRYTAAYFRIIARRRAKPYWGHTENHHVIPESFFIVRKRKGPAGWIDGDCDDSSNKIDLSAKEHFICHWLLTMMTTGMARKKCLNALRGMKAASKKHNRYHGKITASVYAALKEDIAQAQREAVSGDKNPMAGDKFYRSEEGEARRQLVMTGDTNPAKRPEVGKAISDAKTGVPRESFSDEWRANLSAAKTGDKNPRYNVTLSDELKDTLRELASDRTWIKRNTEEKRVKNNVLQSYLDDEWVVGRIERPRKKRGPYKKKTETT